MRIAAAARRQEALTLFIATPLQRPAFDIVPNELLNFTIKAENSKKTSPRVNALGL